MLAEVNISRRFDWRSWYSVERFYYDFVKEALYSQDEAVLKEWLASELCELPASQMVCAYRGLQKMNMLLTVMK